VSKPMRSESLRLTLLGPPQMERDGAPVSVHTRKAIALVAYLTVTGQAHSREALAALLWPEYERERAFANLRRTLWLLNNTLGRQWVDADAETVALRRGAGFWLDVEAFRDRLAASQAHEHGDAGLCSACLPLLTEAVELYGDDFMAGFTLPDSPGFDEWQFFEREGLRRELEGALQSLVRWHAAQEDLEPAIAYARRRLALEPLQESAHRELMQLYAWHGQRAAALRQYQQCFRILEAELGTPPEEETTRLYEAIQARQLLPPPAAAHPEAATPAQPRHNLPPPPTSFVGRQEELAEIARLLGTPDCRLLTLSGPGGVGKSRLALEAAADQLALSPTPYPHGVYLVSLAGVSSAQFIVPAIADAVGFSFYGSERGDVTRQLLDYLCEKQMLLLLDTLEHLLDGLELLAEILDQAPGVELLATSRERLNLQHEWVFPVPGLRYPDAEPVEPPEAYSALQLFLLRARQVDTAFSVPEEEIPDLIRICRLVDGTPLSLELAATWVKMLSCREIATQIEHSLDFLTTSMRDVPDRHRSMRAVWDHSWGLLSAEEQHVFRTLSVFRGGFQLEAAEQVAGASLVLLSSLVDKSLVHRSRSGRYDVHQVLHQYAAEKLAQAPEDEVETRDRHCTYFAAFLQEREETLKGADQLRALEEIGAELENVRTAWRWAVARSKVAEIRQAAPSLWLFYETRSLLEEGEGAFRHAVEMLDVHAGQGASEEEVAAALGMALACQGLFSKRLYRIEEGAELLRRSLAILRPLGAQRELALANTLLWLPDTGESVAEEEQGLQESLAIFRSLGDRWGVARALRQLGPRALRCGDQADAEQYLLQGLAISREIGDRWNLLFSLFHLGAVLEAAGAFREAKQRYQESLLIVREVGERFSEQECLDHIGFVARILGEYAEARQYHEESLALAREIGDRLGAAGSLDNLGLVSRDLGDYKQAARYFREGLALRKEVGHQWSIAVSLENLGDVALALGRVEEARQWYEESLEVGQGAGWLWLSLHARGGLGAVAAARGDLQQARQHFRGALKEARAGGWSNVLVNLDLLLAVAQLGVRMGKEEASAGWLATVAVHPASSPRTRDEANRLLDELVSQLPPEAMAAARDRSTDRTLDDVVGEMLEEM
jgi:predicted ATPase/DNA-binding SARP family transcriptional activator